MKGFHFRKLFQNCSTRISHYYCNMSPTVILIFMGWIKEAMLEVLVSDHFCLMLNLVLAWQLYSYHIYCNDSIFLDNSKHFYKVHSIQFGHHRKKIAVFALNEKKRKQKTCWIFVNKSNLQWGHKQQPRGGGGRQEALGWEDWWLSTWGFSRACQGGWPMLLKELCWETILHFQVQNILW